MAFKVGLVAVPSILGAFLFNSGTYDLLVSKMNKVTVSTPRRRKQRIRGEYYFNSELQSKNFGSNDSMIPNSRFDILS